jgi:hypothetical protein
MLYMYCIKFLFTNFTEEEIESITSFTEEEIESIMSLKINAADELVKKGRMYRCIYCLIN